MQQHVSTCAIEFASIAMISLDTHQYSSFTYNMLAKSHPDYESSAIHLDIYIFDTFYQDPLLALVTFALLYPCALVLGRIVTFDRPVFDRGREGTSGNRRDSLTSLMRAAWVQVGKHTVGVLQVVTGYIANSVFLPIEDTTLSKV